MKMSSIKTVYDFMRYCRMPLYFQRSIRDMKVGDTFILEKYTHPTADDSDAFHVPQRVSDDGKAHFVAEAWIEKERGLALFLKVNRLTPAMRICRTARLRCYRHYALGKQAVVTPSR